MSQNSAAQTMSRIVLVSMIFTAGIAIIVIPIILASLFNKTGVDSKEIKLEPGVVVTPTPRANTSDLPDGSSKAAGLGIRQLRPEVLQYLMSAERDQRFTALAEKAAPVIAESLATEQLGQVIAVAYRDGESIPLTDDFAGPGGLATWDGNSLSPFRTRAMFTWALGQTIDPSQPITAFSVTNTGPLMTEILIMAPDEREPYWTAFVLDYQGDNPYDAFSSSVYTRGLKLYGRGPIPPSMLSFENPFTVEEYQQFDESVLKQFTNMMNTKYPGWND